MQNEKLFNKIKHTALTETPGSEDYNPEKIWADIKRKENKRRVWLWMPYAAASVLLLIGISIWSSQVIQSDSPAVAEDNRGQKTDKDLLKDTKEDVAKSGKTNVTYSLTKDSPHSNALVKDRLEDGIILPKKETSLTANQIFADTLISEENVAAIVDTSNNINDKIPESSKGKIEKVLIADISLPEEKSNDQSALRQIFDQAKKDRQARKMRVQIDREIRKPSLLSFVHNSFVEYPPVVVPAQKKKSNNPH